MYKLFKRLFDVLFSVVTLILISPVLVIVVLVLWASQGCPIFYVSKRFVSRDNEIKVYKFRTMVLDAKSEKYALEKRFMRDGYLDIPIDCEVYTGFGRFLERTQLVESLQLINVLFDGMSLIGNRPLPEANIKLLKSFDGWDKRFDSPAGMTGITQVVGKFELEPIERISLEAKYSDVYQRGNVFLCDAHILFYTIRLIMKGKTLPLANAHGLLDSHLTKK